MTTLQHVVSTIVQPSSLFLSGVQHLDEFSAGPPPGDASIDSIPLESADDSLFARPFRTREEARGEGYEVLAGPYSRPQRWMARRLLLDLSRDSEIGVCFVKRPRGFEIWTRPSPRQRAITEKLMPELSCESARRPLRVYHPRMEA